MVPSGGTPTYSAAKLMQALHTLCRRSNSHVLHLGGADAAVWPSRYQWGRCAILLVQPLSNDPA
jgi:hypothetical protein